MHRPQPASPLSKRESCLILYLSTEYEPRRSEATNAEHTIWLRRQFRTRSPVTKYFVSLPHKILSALDPDSLAYGSVRLSSPVPVTNTKAPMLCIGTSCSLLPQHYINIPLFFNREYMQQMAQRLALIKLMIRLEEVESVQ